MLSTCMSIFNCTVSELEHFAMQPLIEDGIIGHGKRIATYNLHVARTLLFLLVVCGDHFYVVYHSYSSYIAIL